MPAADALKQQDRWESVVEPGQLPTSFMRAAQRRQVSLVFGWSSMPDYWRSRVPARNREYRTPRVGRSHFGGVGSGSRSAAPTYPQPPHKWTTSPDSGRTGGSLRASRIASPHGTGVPAQGLSEQASNGHVHQGHAGLTHQRASLSQDGTLLDSWNDLATS